MALAALSTNPDLVQRRAEADAARNAGFAAAHAIAKEHELRGEPFVWSKLEEGYTTNPYKMVAYADEGHERPAWEDGYNTALMDIARLKIVRREDMKEDEQSLLNGWDMGTGTRMSSYADAVRCAEYLTKVFGVEYIGEDRGEWVSPRYSVVPAYRIGEPVSYGFNGDSYIAGRVVSISGGPDGKRIITVKSAKGVVSKFWRRGLAGSWRKDGTWSLMHGWHRDTNWSF